MIPRRYLILIVIPTVLMVAGTTGYYLLEEDYTLFDSLYMTVITLTTVGYEEVHPPLSMAGRCFTIVLLLVGVLTFIYTVTEMIRVVISGEVRQILGRQRMDAQFGGFGKSYDYLRIWPYGPASMSGIFPAEAAVRHHRSPGRTAARFRGAARHRFVRRRHLRHGSQTCRRRARPRW